ncbi:MAG: helix-turn-helix transcriptional regulator [Clostridia bacterium]|nr:helix-turn-helix transcriptional regulator [Clostridia bacterium]
MRILFVSEDRQYADSFEKAFQHEFASGENILDIQPRIDKNLLREPDIAFVDLTVDDCCKQIECLKNLYSAARLCVLTEGFGALKALNSLARVTPDAYYFKNNDYTPLICDIRKVLQKRSELYLSDKAMDADTEILNREKPALYENFIRELFAGSADDIKDVPTEAACFSEYINPNGRFYTIAVSMVDNSYDTRQRLLHLLALKDEAVKWLPGVNSLSIIYNSYVVILADISRWDGIPNAELLLYYSLLSHIHAFREKKSIELSVGISRESDMTALRNACLEASAACKWGTEHAEMRPIIKFNDFAVASGVSSLIDRSVLEMLTRAETFTDPATVRRIMSSYINSIYKYEGEDGTVLNRLRMDATAILMLAFSGMSIPLNAGQVNALLAEEDIKTTDELLDWFVKQSNRLLRKQQQNAVRKELMLVEKAKKLVVQNPAYHYTTNSMAQELELSPNYFGQIFKRCEGVSFLEYATAHSLLVAVKLLSDPRMRLNEVSCMVGYSDANYFSRLFKKHYGVTPSEFRNRIR